MFNMWTLIIYATQLFIVGICVKPYENEAKVLSCQPRVTMASSFVYKVIRDLASIDYLCINPIRRIGLIHK